jgi:hypothetical protein
MEIVDGNKKTDDFNASEGWFKKTIKKIKEWRWYLLVAEFVLGCGKKIFNKWKNPHIKLDKEYKRKVMDRMDRDNNKDNTGADYRGHRGGWQIVTRVAHYLRNVSALIEDNTFLIGIGMGIGVDGCGNIHRFLERGTMFFGEENYNADAIIRRILNNQDLNLWGLNLDNMRDLLVALNQEIERADEVGHQLIDNRLINRRDDIAERIEVLERKAAAADAREEAAAEATRRLNRIRGLNYNDFLDCPIPARYELRERAAFRDQANRVLANDGIPLGQRRDLRGNLEVRGLRGLYNPVRAAVLNIVPEEDGAAIRAQFAREANPELERIVREGVESATREGVEIPMWARAVVDGATERERREEAARAAAPQPPVAAQPQPPVADAAGAEEEAAAGYLHIAGIQTVRAGFGIFNNENYNAQAIIWNIITGHRVDLHTLTLENLRDLNNALDVVINDANAGRIPEQVFARMGLSALRYRLNEVQSGISVLIADKIRKLQRT